MDNELPSYLRDGFYEKYRLEKTSGDPIDPNAKYFVLRYDKDPNAVMAVIAYAVSITGKNSQFAQELLQKVYIHAEKMGKLKEWADAMHFLSYWSEAKREQFEQSLIRADIEAAHANDDD